MPVQPVLLAFAASISCLALLLSPIGRKLILDHPNERSLHARPVPRTGGLAILAGVAAAAAVSSATLTAALVGALALAAVSFADDLFGLRTLARLAAHLAAAGAVLVLELGTQNLLVLALLLVAVAWCANLYNFMDGSDGLAGGMAIIGFGAYALAAQDSGHAALASTSAAIASASAAFLLFNFHPARIFMGDVGSVPLGFLAGTLGVLGWRDGVWPLWFAPLVFAPFVCDATLTLLKRALRRERVWQAHREHYYQRLLRSGLGHRGTAYVEYAVMAGCSAVALGAREAGGLMQAVSLAAAAAVLAVIALWVDARWARHVRESGGAA